MDIRIGNDIHMNITLKGSEDVPCTQLNVVKIETRLFHVNCDKCSCHRFPKFYDPTPYTTHNSGVPVYHVHPSYEVCDYAKFHPEFTEPHWWPNYCGFGVCSKDFCKKECERSILLPTIITEDNQAETIFEAKDLKLLGDYRLIVKFTVYEAGYGTDNLHTYTNDFGIVFRLVREGGWQGEIDLNIPSGEEYIVTAVPNNIDWGTVSIVPNKPTYVAGDTIVITAIPKNGYHFKQWNDGVTQSIRAEVVEDTIEYIAIFEADSPVLDQVVMYGLLDSYQDHYNTQDISSLLTRGKLKSINISTIESQLEEGSYLLENSDGRWSKFYVMFIPEDSGFKALTEDGFGEKADFDDLGPNFLDGTKTLDYMNVTYKEYGEVMQSDGNRKYYITKIEEQ